MPRGQKISCLLATSFKILVANTYTLLTSQSQFETLQQGGIHGNHQGVTPADNYAPGTVTLKEIQCNPILNQNP